MAWFGLRLFVNDPLKRTKRSSMLRSRVAGGTLAITNTCIHVGRTERPKE